MARKPRFLLPGVPQHVVQRGNNREPCFFSDADRRCYLEMLHEAASRNDATVHAYVLMTNHVHLLITPGHEFSIMHTMQDLGRKYVAYVNRTYDRSGTLWEGRYKASLVDSESYLLTCMRYIETNPVRAGMVSSPCNYSWSSFLFNATGKPDKLVTQHALFDSLGETVQARQLAYLALFADSLAAKELLAIRQALQEELVVGREDFKDEIAELLDRQTRTGRSGRPSKDDLRND